MKSRLLLVLLCTLIVAALPAGASAAPIAHSSAVCADFPNQAAAQAAANTIDADGDGVYCESLPCPCAGPGGSPPPTSPPPVAPPTSPIAESPPPQRRAQTIPARVTKVIDGDTIKVRAGRRRYTVRIIGMDTPETRRPGVSVECGGPQASASLKRLAPIGSLVVLKTDPTQATRDRYRRLLAYVRRSGKDLGRTQIDRGHANVYVYGGKAFARTAAYVRSLLAARDARRGVWSRCGGDFHSAS